MDAQIAERVRKLLRLAESNPEPREAALALAQAQALMTRHGIAAEMLREEQGAPEEPMQLWAEPLADRARARARWLWALAITLARANGCALYVENRHGHAQGIRLVGRASDAATVRYLLTYCERAIEALARRNRGNGRTWLNSYRLGCVDAIAAAIRREQSATVDSMRQEAASTNALVVVERAIAVVQRRAADANAAMRSAVPGLVPRSASAARGDAGARLAGRQDGASIYPGSMGGARLGAGARRIEGGR
jgi:hypothetical protein